MWIKRNYEKCSGCRNCEIACSLFHEGKIWPEASRIRVFMFIPGVEIPHLCFQCEQRFCVEACPVQALSIEEKTRAIKVNSSKCTGCSLCIDACPGRVPHLHPNGKYIVICDLCGGEPKCVKVCNEGGWNALELVPREEVSLSELAPKTPQELTKEVAETILGEVAKEVLG